MRRHRSLLLVGVLLGVVILLAVGPAFAADPAQITLTVQDQPNGALLLTAKVTDGKHLPVPDTVVTFQVTTTFGRLVVAEATTDRSGLATAVLPQMTRSGEVSAEADAGAKTLQAAKWIPRPAPSLPRTRPGYDTLSALSPQPGFISPYPVPLEVIVLATVLGGIWVTYGYLVSVLFKIRRAPGGWTSRTSQWR